MTKKTRKKETVASLKRKLKAVKQERDKAGILAGDLTKLLMEARGKLKKVTEITSTPLVIQKLSEMYMSQRGQGHTRAAARGLLPDGILIVHSVPEMYNNITGKAKPEMVVMNDQRAFDSLRGMKRPILVDNKVIIDAGVEVTSLLKKIREAAE